jgi:exo-beta-1,3-glucanase (GH17 family)/glycosyltransferase involved in cell wall biosynthesis
LALLLLVAVPALNIVLWRQCRKAEVSVTAPFPAQCVSWDPYHESGHDPRRARSLSTSELRRDLGVLATRTRCVRVYRTLGLEQVPALAAEHGLEVILGARLTDDARANQLELDALVALANQHDNIALITLGNETQLQLVDHEDPLVTEDELRAYLRHTRARVEQPVSTAEPHDWWLRHPEFAREVDFVAIHVIPYWAGVAAGDAIDWVYARLAETQAAFPGTFVMIAETGWPSAGPNRGDAETGLGEQAGFVRGFMRRAETDGLRYNLIEAFDQPWKISTWEGRVGAHWGVLDSSGSAKFSMTRSVILPQGWWKWATAASVLGFLGLLAFFLRFTQLRPGGILFGFSMIQLTATVAVYVVRVASLEYMIGSWQVWLLLIPSLIILLFIMMIRVVEGAVVIGDMPLEKAHAIERRAPLATDPFVSIHVPCCNEPPEMVIETIRALVELDYRDYEVLIIDNNTKDEAMWKPVRDFCAKLGPRFRFFHLPKIDGFKAGALNYALDHTDPRATIVGVIDSDYIVSRSWLREAIPGFDVGSVAVVQAPQSYRDWERDGFQRAARDEYEGFFRVGMVQRNEANALIQHGTMTLVRRQVLEDVGRWSTWCICEDAELGLRILERGHEIRYIDKSLGQGLVPPTFQSYAKQRYRWVYGAMRIMIHHRRSLFGLKAGLNWRQRYHFLAGWFPWIGESLHSLFSLCGLLVALAVLADPRRFPPLEFAFPLIQFTAVQALVVLLTYRKRVGIGVRRRVVALVAGAALTPTIARGVWRGIFSSKLAFHVTAKKQSRLSGGLRKLGALPIETALGFGLAAASIAVVGRYGLRAEPLVWSAALMLQALPCLCASYFAVTSGRQPATAAAPASKPLCVSLTDTGSAMM